jgi:hypothetical protein
MDLSRALLLALICGVCLTLAWRTQLVPKLATLAGAMLASGLLFLPGPRLVAIFGAHNVAQWNRWARLTPWSLSDWAHFAIFVLLGALLWICRTDLRGWRAWAVIAVLATAAELAQELAPGRSPEIRDVVLNLLGGALGLQLGRGSRSLCALIRGQNTLEKSEK